jgi:hypothetical protein
MPRLMRLSTLLLAVALVFAGCGKSKSSSDTTTTSSSTTSSTASTTTTVVLTSDSKVAAALSTSILDGAGVKAALGLSADATAYTGSAAAPAPPQGPLSIDGVAKVFPDPAYKGLLEQGQASVGANKSFLVPAGSSGYVLNILAVKFKDGTTGGTFVQSASQVATTFGGAKTNAHPEVKIGLTPGAVLVVPPAAGAQTETVVIASLYADGVYYLVSTTAPPGVIKDETVIKVLTAQNTKYTANKAAIDSAS